MDYRNAFLNGSNRKVQGLQDYSALNNIQTVDASDNYGFWDGAMDVGKSALSYGATGASIDAALGGTTLGLGAAIGTVVGAGIGIWDAFKSNEEDEAQQKAAQEFNAKQEAMKLEQQQIIKQQNQAVIDKFNSETRLENLNSYQNAISAAKGYSTI